MVGRLKSWHLWGNSQTLPRSDELSVKIDKGDFLLDKLGVGRPNCARETGCPAMKKYGKKAFAGLPQNLLTHEKESSSLELSKGLMDE